MIAQDTGSAIVGPARADLYFGAGPDAGKIAGRLKSNMRFVMLVPKSLDPVARGKKLPLPDARPSEQIAKLFRQAVPSPAAAAPAKDQTKDQSKDQPRDQKTASSATPTVGQAAATIVPLPVERPKSAPPAELHQSREPRHLRHP
jgi:membrane-bound lytic murein transglycosylase A